MNDLNYDDGNKAKLRFSEAVFRVWRKRHDLEAIVMQGHRYYLTKQSNDDPFVRSSKLSVAISYAQENPDDLSYNEARLEMISALLYVWYRI